MVRIIQCPDLKAARWTPPPKPKVVPEFLTSLPGEIRNLIFECCIADALDSPKAKRSRQGANATNGFTIDALPQWRGPSRIKMNGIGSLPLIFVNKIIFNELSLVLYSKVSELTLGGYMVQFRGEDPSLRWKQIYPLLENRPGLQHFANNVKVTLPCVRTDMVQGHWRSLLYYRPPVPLTGDFDPWATIPGLTEFLKTFTKLSVLQIVINMDKEEAPDFTGLLPLWDISPQTIVTIKSPHSTWTLDWHAKWEPAWRECLVKNNRTKADPLVP